MMPDEQGVLLEVRDLKVHFPVRTSLMTQMVHGSGGQRWVKAVDGVTFSVARGRTLGLAGESGCGKTTTAKTMVRLYKPTAGQVAFEGADIANLGGRALTNFRHRAQMVFQDPYESLNPRFNIQAVLEEPLVIHGMKSAKERMARMVETLDIVGLTPPSVYLSRYPHQMSGGQRQRVAIARALVLRPSFMVADEPVSMLDVSIRAGILNLMKQLIRNMDMAGMYISHDLSLIRYMCDQTGIMYLGRIVEIGDTEDVVRHPMHPYSQALLSAVPVPEVTHEEIMVPLEGEPPNPVDLPPGCRFGPRCERRMDICTRVAPKPVAVGGARWVECHLYSERQEQPEQEMVVDD